MGDTSSAAKRQLEAAASKGFDTAKTAVGEIYDETSRQAEAEGLTTKGMGKAARHQPARPACGRGRRNHGVRTFTRQSSTQNARRKRPWLSQKFTTGNRTGSGPSHGFEKAAEKATTASKNVTDQALSAGREIKDKASGLVDAASNTVKERASEFVDTARGRCVSGN